MQKSNNSPSKRKSPVGSIVLRRSPRKSPKRPSPSSVINNRLRKPSTVRRLNTILETNIYSPKSPKRPKTVLTKLSPNIMSKNGINMFLRNISLKNYNTTLKKNTVNLLKRRVQYYYKTQPFKSQKNAGKNILIHLNRRRKQYGF